MPKVYKNLSDAEPEFSRRHFLKVMVAGAAGVAFVACVPGTEDGGNNNSGDTNTLRIGWAGSPVNLDPITASADVEIAFLNAVYDYLIDTNAAGELVPRLATEWDASSDATVFTLTLAEGVTFHNGDAFTVDDAIWTLERLSDPEASTSDLFGSIASLEGDGNTLTITLTDPNPDFLYDLSDNRALMLQANAADIGSEFNGTGPFVFEEFSPEDRVVLTANADYFQGAPAVEGLEFIFFPDVEAAVNALRSGNLDGVVRLDNPTFLNLSEETTFNAIDIPTNGHDLVRLRADREPGNNPLVRRAFKLATNRQEVFERVQLGFGALGRDTPIGPLYSNYYTEEFDLPPHDPDQARELLAEAGYEDGLEMTLYVPDAPGRADLAQVLQAQWAEAGINVTLEVQDEATYYDGNWLDVDLGITPWASRAYPQFYLDVAYKTDSIWNEAHFSDQELDALIDEAAATVDGTRRSEIYAEIQGILNERGPVIIPYFFASLGVFRGAVEGLDLHPFPGRTNFAQVSLQQE